MKMNSDTISEIAIDDSGRLTVKPSRQEFEHIYRAALEVHWDHKKHCLYSPKPREWSYLDWYKQIVSAVMSEYGYKLVVNQETKWAEIPNTLKQEIEDWETKKQ